MIYQNIEFHNVIELEKREEIPGLQFQRIPKKVRDSLNPRGRWNSQMAPGSEIRFVTTADHIRLFISTLEGDGDLLVFCGDLLHSRHYLRSGEMLCVHVTPPERFQMVKEEAFTGSRFSPKVWRFFTAAYFPIFHQLETFGHAVWPPEEDEKPRKRWLAYGSSITAGSGASRPDFSYPQIVARRLGVDVLNMGMGGACMCEKELADFFAEELEWDFATLEIGVNMRDVFSPEEFRERAEYMVKTVVVKNPGKPAILITPFTNLVDYEKEESPAGRNQRAYEEILHEIYSKYREKNVYLIEGREILPDFCGLNTDLIHPGDFGNIIMAENLSSRLAEFLSL